MKFRKLYWVTEQLDQDGKSEVVGIYTSIFDLTTKGLRWDSGVSGSAGFRLSLCKLDAQSKALGCWTGPSFDGIGDDLQPYVSTGEFDEPSVLKLIQDLEAFASSAAQA